MLILGDSGGKMSADHTNKTITMTDPIRYDVTGCNLRAACEMARLNQQLEAKDERIAELEIEKHDLRRHIAELEAEVSRLISLLSG
jgi:predicted RNase H-like nuclease (RuvC/YqgF family)